MVPRISTDAWNTETKTNELCLNNLWWFLWPWSVSGSPNGQFGDQDGPHHPGKHKAEIEMRYLEIGASEGNDLLTAIKTRTGTWKKITLGLPSAKKQWSFPTVGWKLDLLETISCHVDGYEECLDNNHGNKFTIFSLLCKNYLNCKKGDWGEKRKSPGKDPIKDFSPTGAQGRGHLSIIQPSSAINGSRVAAEAKQFCYAIHTFALVKVWWRSKHMTVIQENIAILQK